MLISTSFIACLAYFHTKAVRKSAILATVKGGLSDLVALDDGVRVEEGEEDMPVTEPLAYCAWCV